MKEVIAYAIDFGTSNSLLGAVYSDHTSELINLETETDDPTILRSVMYFPKVGDAVFGRTAVKDYAESGGDGRLIRSIKKYLPSGSFTSTRIGQRNHSLEDLIGRFLREMKSRADEKLGADVKRVVLGRPAKFSLESDKDRLAQDRLSQAARLAGFEEIEFFAEPLAAAYDFRQNMTEEKRVLVVDLGGGTSDYTVIQLQQKSSKVLSLGGVSIAGDAIDGSIMSEKISPFLGSEVKYRLPLSSNVLEMPPDLKYRLQSPADITLMSRSDILHFLNEVNRSALGEKDKVCMERLFALIEENLGFAIFEAIEKSKREVCTQQTTHFSFDYPEIMISCDYNYQDFLQFADKPLGKIFSTLEEVVEQSGLSFQEIDLICCTGGTAKVPAVNKYLQDRFGQQKIKSFKNFHSVIHGLSERAKEIF